jgi:hypothetical protein
MGGDNLDGNAISLLKRVEGKNQVLANLPSVDQPAISIRILSSRRRRSRIGHNEDPQNRLHARILRCNRYIPDNKAGLPGSAFYRNLASTVDGTIVLSR